MTYGALMHEGVAALRPHLNSAFSADKLVSLVVQYSAEMTATGAVVLTLTAVWLSRKFANRIRGNANVKVDEETRTISDRRNAQNGENDGMVKSVRRGHTLALNVLS